MKLALQAGCLALFATLAILGSNTAASEPSSSFTIRADWFDRGNVRVSNSGQIYADRYACIWHGGVLPNRAEYEIDFPVTAEYTFVGLYAAAGKRPVEIHLDGKLVHLGFAGLSGSWQTGTARWEEQCQMHVTAGRHTIALVSHGHPMPHICAFRLQSPVAFAKDWRLDRTAARQRIDQPAATAAKPASSPAHLIPEIAILSEANGPLAVEVIRADQYVAGGTAARNELLQRRDEVDAAETPWIALLRRGTDDEATERAVLGLSPERLREKLVRSARMIDDFRTMKDVGEQPFETERGRIEEMLAQLDDVLMRPDGRQKWEQLAALYVSGSRLEQRVAAANPLLDFDRLLLIRRSAASPALGLPQNWQSNCVLPRTGFDDEIAVLSPVRPGGELTQLYRPAGSYFVGDVDLHFDAGKMLFSSIGEDGRWHIFEMAADGSGVRQMTPNLGDVDQYDACYLPDGRILFSSTAFMAAVPCVNGSTRVANLYRMDADGENIRQLCFDQEHNWCPTVLPTGRVLYLRWEYTDTPHSHDRVLFSMNPDGTGQMEYYGSNSYWPNSNFYARPIPGHPTRFVGIVGGHHGVPRMGELVLFDSARGRREAGGAIQRIPGHGRPVESVTDDRYESSLIADNLVDGSWPKFLHPYPLSEKYFLVSCQPTSGSHWGVYLVDVYDNMLLLKEEPGQVLFEPVPFRPAPTPPVIPDRVDETRSDALVYLSDVYHGDGLKGIPRGTVKSLRLLSYHYLFPGMGGPQGVVGMEGPWDIKRIVGTVPVEEDGSAVFRIPANTPIAVQPLDSEGKAVQLMRSWFTGMPGEVVSCAGCHESQNTGPPAQKTLAAARRPSEITPWYGPTRGFNFQREVQPVLDRYCVGCHNGTPRDDGRSIADLRGLEQISDYTSVFHFGGVDAGHFSTSYAELHRYVRRPGLESDYHMLTPMEYHADSTQLVQLLSKGHHNVRLDAEAWDRLITWVDLNAPYHGTWTEVAGAQRVKPLADRRRELLIRFANLDVDPEAIFVGNREKIEPILPEPLPQGEAVLPSVPGWPFDAEVAQRRQTAQRDQADKRQHRRTIDLADEVRLQLVRIPAGEFAMGDPDGHPDEQPVCHVKIETPFWMGQCEVTNEQYALFDPAHDSRVESKHAMQFGVRGFYVNHPQQPVVRLSHSQAVAFCRWLSRKTGLRFDLPTEAQWEYACRAGSDEPFYYGDLNSDFSPFANLGDAMLREFVCHPYKKHREPYPNPGRYDDWIPKDDRFNDGGFVSEDVGGYRPNAWGLHDMHGNVAEWTRSAKRPYPYRDDDGRNRLDSDEDRVARGGSWRDRPSRARAAFRLGYRPYQNVYNVGFRVVCSADEPQ